VADFDPRLLAPCATITGIIVSIILWILNLKRKEMTYEVVSDTPVVTLGKAAPHEDLHITFHGQAVRDLHLILLRISNAGHVPIKPDEYADKLTITIPGDGKILHADIAETMPSNLAPPPAPGAVSDLIEAANERQVVLRPFLLNGKDYIVVKVLVCNPGAPLVVSGHIVGINEIRIAKESNRLPLILANAGAFTMAVSLFFLEPETLFSNNVFEYLPYLLFFLIGYNMLLCGVHYRALTKLRRSPVRHIAPKFPEKNLG